MAHFHSVPCSLFHSVIVEYESEPGELRAIYFGLERMLNQGFLIQR
jgi:hypothetical protein